MSEPYGLVPNESQMEWLISEEIDKALKNGEGVISREEALRRARENAAEVDWLSYKESGLPVLPSPGGRGWIRWGDNTPNSPNYVPYPEEEEEGEADVDIPRIAGSVPDHLYDLSGSVPDHLRFGNSINASAAGDPWSQSRRPRTSAVGTDSRYNPESIQQLSGESPTNDPYLEGEEPPTFDDLVAEFVREGYTPAQARAKARVFDAVYSDPAQDYSAGGADADAYNAWLQSPEYQQMFGHVNDKRRANGGMPMTDLQIVQARGAYRRVLRISGMPPEFYDSDADADAFLANNVSPTELGTRIDLAKRVVGENVAPEVKQAFKQFYGLEDNDLAAYMLDPKRALPALEKRSQAAVIGGAALRQGLESTQDYAEELFTEGVTEAEANEGFGEVALTAPDAAAIAGAGNTGITMEEQTDAALGLDATAKRKVRRLASQERARFRGSSQPSGQSMLQDEVSGSY